MNQESSITPNQVKVGLAALPKTLWYSVSIGIVFLSAALTFMIFTAAKIELSVGGNTMAITRAYDQITMAEGQLEITMMKLEDQATALETWEKALKEQEKEIQAKAELLKRSVTSNNIRPETIEELLQPTKTFTPPLQASPNLEPNFNQLSTIRENLSLTAQGLSPATRQPLAP